MAIVELKNVSRVYTSGDHELKALDGVNLSRRRQIRSYLRTFGRREEYSFEPARRIGQSDFGDDHRLRK